MKALKAGCPCLTLNNDKNLYQLKNSQINMFSIETNEIVSYLKKKNPFDLSFLTLCIFSAYQTVSLFRRVMTPQVFKSQSMFPQYKLSKILYCILLANLFFFLRHESSRVAAYHDVYFNRNKRLAVALLF